MLKRAAIRKPLTLGATPFLVCCASDRPLLDAAAALGVDVIAISERAMQAEDWDEIFGEVPAKLAGRFDWIIEANFTCRPFLSVDTVVKVVQRCQVAERPFVVTRTYRGTVWDGASQCILGDGELANTKTNPLYHVLAHIAYAMPFEMLANKSKVLAAIEPFALEIGSAEMIDIDTAADLDFARTYARGLTEGGG